MTPFFKTTGGNEIEVVVNSARAVKCWYHGSSNGQGYCRKHTFAEATYYSGSKYLATRQYDMFPMIICKIGKVVGTASTGDAIMIPSW